MIVDDGGKNGVRVILREPQWGQIAGTAANEKTQ